MSARTIGAVVALLAVGVGVGWALGSAAREPAPSALEPEPAENEASQAPPVLESKLGQQMRDETIAELRERVEELEDELRKTKAAQPAPSAGAQGGAEKAKPKRDDTTGQALLEKMRDFTAGRLAELKTISLRGATLTPADLELLSSLTNLTHLSLRSTNITDEGLAALAGLPLQHLDLRGTAVTGAGMGHLPRDLISLHLTDTKVAPRDLDRIPQMDRLQTLKLNGIAVDDAGIDQIARFRSLRHLEVDRTLITEEGLARLMERSPDIQRIEARQSAVDIRKVGDLLAAYPNLDLVLQRFPLAHLPR